MRSELSLIDCWTATQGVSRKKCLGESQLSPYPGPHLNFRLKKSSKFCLASLHTPRSLPKGGIRSTGCNFSVFRRLSNNVWSRPIRTSIDWINLQIVGDLSSYANVGKLINGSEFIVSPKGIHSHIIIHNTKKLSLPVCMPPLGSDLGVCKPASASASIFAR